MNRLFFFLLTCLTFSAFGQYKWADLDKIIQKNNIKMLAEYNYNLLEEGIFYQASLLSEKLLLKDSTSPNWNFRHGLALINMTPDYNKALPYLKKAVDSIDLNYNFASFKQYGAPKDAYYQMGYCYHLKGDLQKARVYYTKFLQLEEENTEAATVAEMNLVQLENAEDALRYQSNFILESVGDKVNSPYPEFASIISIDGRNLYFTSRRKREGEENIIDPIDGKYLEDVFMSTKLDNGNWSTPEMLNFSRSDQNEATVALDLNQTTIFLYDDAQGNGDLYYAPIRKDNPFSKIKKLDIPGVNSEFWEPHIAFTGDGNTAYFSSDKPGGYGGRDIYRIVRYGNGHWSTPVNMGPEINSEYDEDSPFISVDGKTMYFASNGIRSMGGFDIFLTVLDEEQNWSYPINLGYPINSTGDDLYYTTTVDGKVAYITSFRPDGSGEKDIYRIIKDDYIPNNNLFVNGNLKTVEEKPEPNEVQITIQCFDCGSDYVIDDLKTTYVDGNYLVALEPGKEYDVIFINTATGQIKKQSIEVIGDGSLKKVGILLDTEKLEIIQEELDDTYFKLTLVGTPGTLVPPKVEVEIECLNCNKYTEKVTQKLNRNNQSLFTQIEGKYYRFTFRDTTGTILLSEDRRHDQALSELSDLDFIFYLDNPTMDVTEVPAALIGEFGYYCPLDFTHNFYYNKDGLTTAKPEFKAFLDSIESQLVQGRSKLKLIVNSSASKVPTRKYKNNTELAKVRADRAQKMLVEYFQSKGLDDKIDIVLGDVSVSGPAYHRIHLRDLEKYAPYQYVEFRVEGIVCSKTQYFVSKDRKLANFNIVPLVKEELEVVMPTNNQQADTNVYTVIAQAFVVERNAIVLISELKSKGYPNAKMFKKEDGYYLVAIDEIEGLTKATQFVQDYNKNSKEKAYIYGK